MRGLCILFFYLFSVSYGMAQDSTALTFRVRDQGMKVSVYPVDTILWTEIANPIRIRIKGEMKLGGVYMKGGKISGSDSTWSAFVTENENSAVLTIYETTAEGAKAVCFTKKYTIKKLTQPKIFVCGVRNDSVIDKFDFHKKNHISAFHPEWKKYLAVSSFSMVYVKNGKKDTLSTPGNQFSLAMREQIYQLPMGSTLVICNIKVMMPDGNNRSVSPVTIFIADTGRSKVGQ